MSVPRTPRTLRHVRAVSAVAWTGCFARRIIERRDADRQWARISMTQTGPGAAGAAPITPLPASGHWKAVPLGQSCFAWTIIARRGAVDCYRLAPRSTFTTIKEGSAVKRKSKLTIAIVTGSLAVLGGNRKRARRPPSSWTCRTCSHRLSSWKRTARDFRTAADGDTRCSTTTPHPTGSRLIPAPQIADARAMWP